MLSNLENSALTTHVSSRQVTIVTSSVAAVGGDSGEARCQCDMEKADVVDGKTAQVSPVPQSSVSGLDQHL